MVTPRCRGERAQQLLKVVDGDEDEAEQDEEESNREKKQARREERSASQEAKKEEMAQLQERLASAFHILFCLSLSLSLCVSFSCLSHVTIFRLGGWIHHV